MLSRFFRYCTRLFCRWHVVAVFRLNCKYKNCNIYYYCQENSFGERKITIRCFPLFESEEDSSEKHAKRNYLWNAQLYPWLLGVTDNEIPKPEEVKKRRFVNSLAGKKNLIEVTESTASGGYGNGS